MHGTGEPGVTSFKSELKSGASPEVPSGAWSSDASAGSQRRRGSATPGSRQVPFTAPFDRAARPMSWSGFSGQVPSLTSEVGYRP